MPTDRRATIVLAIVVLLHGAAARPAAGQQRNEVSFLRGPYNTAMFDRHNRAFRVGAALHFSHAKQHDVLLLTPFAAHDSADHAFDRESVEFVRELKARTEPSQEYYAPYTARFAWRVLRAIDWTHMLHEQTYDILSDDGIAWPDKERWTGRALRYYQEKSRDVAFSPAPLDVTMRRAAVMMKPYFTLFRNYYPRSNNYFYAAHWWHPVIYEAQMLGGNDRDQDSMVRQTDETFYRDVLERRPERMLLLREVAPRYSRLAPGVANSFDNLHMFHGITYDILAYEGWTLEQKRAELDRVIAALRHHPGDERLGRRFGTPHPEVDPRVYEEWMRSPRGEMSRIMHEMMDEMMPIMLPQVGAPVRERVMAQFAMKLRPGLQPGELPGSLHDALMRVAPEMKMMPGATEPGAAADMMVHHMLEGWRRKHGGMPDAPPMPMAAEPPAPAELPAAVTSGGAR